MSTNTLRDPDLLLTSSLLDELLAGIDTADTPWNTTHLHAVSVPWRDLGFAVIPSNGPVNKEPLKGQGWKRWSGEGRSPVGRSRWRDWCCRYGEHEGLLLLDSSTDWLPDLVVVDADDPALFDWCVATFGATPLTVESGREGGGRHHYYRVPDGADVRSRNGCVGPTGSFVLKPSRHDPNTGRWTSKIDIKARRAYVVAPGSKHRTGLTYTASVPITRETLLGLPVFDIAVYERLVAEWRALPRPSTTKGTSSGGTLTSPSSETLAVASGAPEWAVIRAGHAAGHTRIDGCPWCGSASSRVTLVGVTRSGALRAYCFSEEVARIESSAADVPDTDIDALLGAYVAIDAEDEVEDDDEFLEADALFSALEAEGWDAHVGEMIASEARLATLFDDFEPADGSTSSSGELVPPSMSTPTSILGGTSSSTTEVHPFAPTAEDEGVASEWFKALGGRRAWCPRGPCNHAAGRDNVAKTSRLPCNNYRCSVCGPRLVFALRAAARTVVRRVQLPVLVEAASWYGHRFPVPSEPKPAEALEKAIHRWAVVSPAERLCIVVAVSPDRLVGLLLWSGTTNAPVIKRGGGALRRYLDAHGIPVPGDAIPDAVDAMAATVDRKAWADLPDARITILRGCTPLREPIAKLRDFLLGRSRTRAGGARPEGVFSVRTYTSGDEVRREASNRSLSDVEMLDDDVVGRKRAKVETWRLTDGVTPLPAILEAMGKEGFYRPLRRKRAKTVAAVDPFFELSLAAK